MPRKPQHALVWSPDEGLYELRAEGRAARRFAPGDGVAWQGWLAGLGEVAAALPGGRAGDQSAAPPVMSAPDVAGLLPATKLSPPQLPPTLVGRGHLHDALDVAVAAPLTLVAAPAGWGKTTAVVAWARRHPGRVAWLSLDAAD